MGPRSQSSRPWASFTGPAAQPPATQASLGQALLFLWNPRQAQQGHSATPGRHSCSPREHTLLALPAETVQVFFCPFYPCHRHPPSQAWGCGKQKSGYVTHLPAVCPLRPVHPHDSPHGQQNPNSSPQPPTQSRTTPGPLHWLLALSKMFPPDTQVCGSLSQVSTEMAFYPAGFPEHLCQ